MIVFVFEAVLPRERRQTRNRDDLQRLSFGEAGVLV